MKVVFATYPWAFETPGGGEIQLLKYEEHAGRLPGVAVARHDPWSDDLSKAHIVHFFSCVGGSVHFCRYVKSQKIPLVISASLWITEETRHQYPIDEIRAQLSCADIVVTNGDAESDQIVSVIGGLDRSRFQTVRNGCDDDFFLSADPGPFRRRFGLDGPFLLNIANVEPRKNQLALIEAGRVLGLPVVNIGHVRDPEYARDCLAKGKDIWRPIGPLGHSDPLLRSALAACSVFCLPSLLETPGLAAIEAAAAGSPLVVTREGSTTEYFAEHAFYVDPRDTHDIVEKTRAALSQPDTSGLRDHVRTYAWREVVRPLAAIYADLARAAN